MSLEKSNLFYQIALTQIEGVGDILARNLLDTFGCADLIFKSSKNDLCSAKGISSHLADRILDPKVLKKAELELEFIEKNKIEALFYSEEKYPSRLKECVDAPLLLYYKGGSDLNTTKIISIVGTRKSTTYGQDFCNDFLNQIASDYPDVLIVSGLAYGIDICAHRSALESNLPTVGVLAHGLDRIYPASHRKTAVEMLENGGLLTEFASGTEPDKFNFVRRNRIVAGMADAVIVVQSDIKGGSLITADLANSYNKDVFAVPGRITDNESLGCNYLIEQNKAVLLRSTESFVRFMQWDILKDKAKPKQRSLFVELTVEEQPIYDALIAKGALHVNLLASQVKVSMASLLSTLLTMEMKGIIKTSASNTYELV